MFLIQNSALYQQFLDQIIGSVPRSYYLSQYYQDFLTDNQFTHCIDDSFLKRIFLCNFEETLKLCNPKQTEKPKKEDLFLYKRLEFICRILRSNIIIIHESIIFIYSNTFKHFNISNIIK
jgi:hypothetical protein